MRGFGLKYHDARPRSPSVADRNKTSQNTTRGSCCLRSNSEFSGSGVTGEISGLIEGMGVGTGVGTVVSRRQGAGTADADADLT
jgi:hypothetical protein